MSPILRAVKCCALALVLVAMPGLHVQADEKTKAISPRVRLSRIKKLAGDYVSARKQLVCSQCEGKVRITCPTCKGKAWKIKGNNYKRGGVDWEKSAPCPKCNKEGRRPVSAYARREKKRGSEPRNAPGAGKILCKKSFCTFGMNKKAAKKLFWSLRSPIFQKDVKEDLKGISVDDFVELVILHLNPNAKELIAKRVKEVAVSMGVNPDLIQKTIRGKINIKHNWLRLCNTGKLEDSEDSSAEVEMRHFKNKERFLETIYVLWDEDKAYLSLPPKKAANEGEQSIPDGIKEGGDEKEGADGDEKEGADGDEKEGADGDEKPDAKKKKKNRKKKNRKKRKRGKKKNNNTPEPAKPEPKKSGTGNSP
jgi:hypothetical protein